MPDHDEPQLILMDGIDELQLEEGGKVYRPGDVMPQTLSNAKRVSLQAAGVRFETRHDEPVLMPDGKPATARAAQHIAGPAVIASIEDAPTAPDPPAQEPAPQPRRAAREKD